METKFLAVEWNYVLAQTGYNKFLLIDCECDNGGRRGGLCLLWTDDLDISMKSSFNNHILVTVNDGSHAPWDFCGIYGWSRTEDHLHIWNLMRALLLDVSDSWICGGDFNETMYHFEKNGGNMKADSRLVAFRNTVEECGLTNLGFVGDPFTWTNNQRGENNILERLDRVFGSAACIDNFSGFEVAYLLRKSSDHCLLLLMMEKVSDTIHNHPRPFRFEAMWLRDNSCKPFCDRLWETGGIVSLVTYINCKIEAIGRELKLWEKRVFGRVKKRCAQVRDELAELQRPSRDPFKKDEQRKLEDELDEETTLSSGLDG